MSHCHRVANIIDPISNQVYSRYALCSHARTGREVVCRVNQGSVPLPQSLNLGEHSRYQPPPNHSSPKSYLIGTHLQSQETTLSELEAFAVWLLECLRWLMKLHAATYILLDAKLLWWDAKLLRWSTLALTLNVFQRCTKLCYFFAVTLFFLHLHNMSYISIFYRCDALLEIWGPFWLKGVGSLAWRTVGGLTWRCCLRSFWRAWLSRPLWRQSWW